MAIKQITSILPSPTEKLKVQLSVGLCNVRGEPDYCSIYSSGKWQYINVMPMIQLTLKYFVPSRLWSKWDNIYITQRDIGTLREDLKAFYQDIMDHEDDIFGYNDSGYISSISNSNAYTHVIRVGKRQAMRLEPIALYTTENNRPIPGVSLEINTKENRVEMSINEFEMLNDLIQTIQLHQEGMILLHMYMTMCLKNGGLTIPVEEGSGAKQPSEKDVQISIFDRPQKQSEVNANKEMVGGPAIKKQPTKLEDL